MDVKVMLDSEELGQRDYQEVMPGVWACQAERRVVILEPDDTGLMIELEG